MITKFKIYESYYTTEVEEGDVVYCDEQVGLVVSGEYLDSDNYKGFDVCFRSSMGSVYFVETTDIKNVDDEQLGDNLWAYVSIAGKNNYLINIPDEYNEEFPEEYKNQDMRKNTRKYKI